MDASGRSHSGGTSGTSASSIESAGAGQKRKGRTSDTGACAGDSKRMAKQAAENDPAACIVSTKSSVQRCIDEIESAKIKTSSRDLCSLQVDAKRLVDTIDRAILAACQREKEQAAGQAAALVTKELEKLRREQQEGERAADAEIMKLRNEKATVEAIAAAERIKWALCPHAVTPSADWSKLEDEISSFFRYLSSS